MHPPINAKAFAKEWVEAWNDHDLERILSHYATDVELTSPNVARYLGGSGGTIKGLQVLRDYFKKGLEKNPHLRFDLERVYAGIDSVTLQYHHSINQTTAAEVMLLNDQGKIRQVFAHYSV